MHRRMERYTETRNRMTRYGLYSIDRRFLNTKNLQIDRNNVVGEKVKETFRYRRLPCNERAIFKAASSVYMNVPVTSNT